jgi:hypothetical protein
MQNPLGVVFGVDLTPCGAMSGHGTSASSRWLDGARADARDSVRSGQQVRPVSLLTVGGRGRQVAVGDRVVTVEHRGTRGTYPVTGLRGGESGHNDLHVRSLWKKVSEGITALFDRGGINRALGRPWASC